MPMEYHYKREQKNKYFALWSWFSTGEKKKDKSFWKTEI